MNLKLHMRSSNNLGPSPEHSPSKNCKGGPLLSLHGVLQAKSVLRIVSPFATAHTFCASQGGMRTSNLQKNIRLLIQRYLCMVHH